MMQSLVVAVSLDDVRDRKWRESAHWNQAVRVLVDEAKARQITETAAPKMLDPGLGINDSWVIKQDGLQVRCLVFFDLCPRDPVGPGRMVGQVQLFWDDTHEADLV
jgi:hypothetical protein